MSIQSTETTITTQPTYAGDEAVAALVAALNRYLDLHNMYLLQMTCNCAACIEARMAIEMAGRAK